MVLRQQIVVLRRGRPSRPHVLVIDRLVLGYGSAGYFLTLVVRWS